MPTPIVLATALSLSPAVPQDRFVESRVMVPSVGESQPTDAAAGDVELEVHGYPGTPFALAAAPAAAEIPLPPFGVLQLQPSSLLLLASGIVPVSGFAAFSPPLGSDATLVGVTLHLQAIVGAPLKLTPREAATVTAF